MQKLIFTILSALFLASCGGTSNDSNSNDGNQNDVDPEQPLTRSFNMGFTPWLYEASTTAADTTYSRLLNHGDMIKHHLLGGVPWQEALEQSPYHENLEAEIQGRQARTPAGINVFLAIDALDTSRSNLAPNRGETDNIPLVGDWATRSWSSQEVIDAYINYSVDMINRFQPTHFEYGTEISELILNDLNGYNDFLVFAEAVYSSLKSSYPNLKVMISVALKHPDSSEMQIIDANIGEILDFTDVLGISVYPYVFFNHDDRGNPANLPPEWLNQANNLASGKTLAISESGWIGESLEISEYSYSATSSGQYQNQYLSELLEGSNDMNMDFVIWWTVTDFDTLWTDTLAEDPLAKIWKDIGLYDQNQVARPALQTWDEWLERDLR